MSDSRFKPGFIVSVRARASASNAGTLDSYPHRGKQDVARATDTELTEVEQELWKNQLEHALKGMLCLADHLEAPRLRVFATSKLGEVARLRARGREGSLSTAV